MGSAIGVIRDYGLATQTIGESSGEFAPDRGPILVRAEAGGFRDVLALVLWDSREAGRTIAAEDPKDVGAILQAGGEVFRIAAGVGEIVVPEEPRSVPPWGCELVSPGGQQGDVEAPGGGFIDDFYDAVEIGRVRFEGVVIDEWAQAESTRFVHALEFGQHHGLDHRKILETPLVEVIAGFFPRGVMDEFPCGVAQPEERPTVFGLEIMTRGMNLDALKRRILRSLLGNGGMKAGKRFSGHGCQSCCEKHAPIHRDFPPEGAIRSLKERTLGLRVMGLTHLWRGLKRDHASEGCDTTVGDSAAAEPAAVAASVVAAGAAAAASLPSPAAGCALGHWVRSRAESRRASAAAGSAAVVPP